MKSLSTVFLGDYSQKVIRRLRGKVEQINRLGDEISRLSDDDLRARTAAMRERIAAGASLESVLVEAFAVAREGAQRAIGQRPYDVQLLGGMVMHDGKIAEMKTGEGKTLAAVLPGYLNALTGRGVHVVTVNDYLAKRDSEWMGQIFKLLGLSVGLVVHDKEPDARREAYACDITYGTNNEFGFDYLRDNMAYEMGQVVQRGFYYAIVDEVDSILIDEARTPLIISGPGTESKELYYSFARVVRNLKVEEDYTVDEKAKAVSPTEAGIAKVEKALDVSNLYETADTDLSHYLMQALKAHALFHLDKDYVVKDGEVIIVDEFTGRLMFGRRYSDGLHQAIEAKENVDVKEESQTLATITFQNYFRLYEKLAGMTGTAVTEEEEFRKIYGLDVVVVPTNKPMIRDDMADLVYKTEDAKFKAAVEDIVRRHEKQQPVLVGTVSIEKSERFSKALDRRGIDHQVLNAKHHEREAEIIARAGQPGAVTIATNMAGRGTDIVLGDGVANVGGLHVIGTERHESRRIDNQLRGRSGRQGDPGSSQFYISLEDDLMRIFAADTISGLMDRLGMTEDQPIEHGMLTKAIERAQRKVEARNFEIRKHILEYDDVMNMQREVVYSERRRVLEGEDTAEHVRSMIGDVVSATVAQFCVDGVHPDEWNFEGLVQAGETIFLFPGQIDPATLQGLTRDEIAAKLTESALGAYNAKEEALGPELMRGLERWALLTRLDTKWIPHIELMQDLREGISLRAYGQRDPLVEYKREAFDMFQEMLDSVKEDVVRYVFKWVPVIQVIPEGEDGQPGEPVLVTPQLVITQAEDDEEPVSPDQPIGRNDPCPCGSGKKYKKCHGAKAGD